MHSERIFRATTKTDVVALCVNYIQTRNIEGFSSLGNPRFVGYTEDVPRQESWECRVIVWK